MENIKIDWDLAPEWAIAHALFAFGSEISEVWVGEDKWQRLTQDKSFPYGGGGGDAHHNPTRKQFKYETLRPEWVDGELPPVGTVCEYNNYEPHPVDVELKWSRVEIVARHTQGLDDFAVFASVSGYHGSRVPKRFRPIRTPEQIAAEEREKELNRMVATVSMLDKGWARKVCAGLYDNGYRKVTP